MECDNMFQGSMNSCEQMLPCIMRCFQDAMKAPSSSQNYQDVISESRPVKRDRDRDRERDMDRSSLQQDFRGPCNDLIEMTQKMMEGMHQQFIERPEPSTNTTTTTTNTQDRLAENESTVDKRMVCCCWEVCHHSNDCLKKRDKYEKPKEKQTVDTSGKGTFKRDFQERFEDSMRLAEKLTNQCEDLLQKLQKEMSATASLLEQLSEQFESLSKSEKKEEKNDDVYEMTTVIASAKTGKRSSDTSLNRPYYDSNPNTYTGPEDTSWEDSKFAKPLVQNFAAAACCSKRVS